MKKKLTVILALIGTNLLIGVGGYVWVHRMELFILPKAWKKVIDSHEKKEDLTPSVREYLDLTNKEIKLAEVSQLQELRTREGEVVHLLCYKPMPLRSVPNQFERFWDYHDHRHLLIRGNGHIIKNKSPLYAQHLSGIQHKVIRGSKFDKIFFFDPQPGSFNFELSVDSHGFVPHGYLGPHTERTYALWKADNKKALSSSFIDSLLNSSKPADHLRALNIIEFSGNDYPPARKLYKSRNRIVKKKALFALGCKDPEIKNLRQFVTHPDPELRLSALYPLAHRAEFDQELQAFLQDPDPEIREIAHWFLSYSDDLKLARESGLYLLKTKSRLCVSTHAHHVGHGLYFQQLSSKEIVDQVLKIIEEDIDLIYKSNNQFVLGEYLEMELNQLKVEHLSLFIPRLIAIYNKLVPRVKKDEYWKLKGVILTLLAQETDECDPLIAPRIRFDLEDSVSYQGYFEGLVKRVKPVKELIPDLWKLDQKWERESKEEDLSFGGEYLISPSLWFLAKWNIGKSRMLLIQRLKARTNRLILDPNLLYSFVDEVFQKELEAHGISFSESSEISFDE